MRAITALLILIISLQLVSALEGFADGSSHVTAGDSIIITDTIIYNTGYISDNGNDWQEFRFSGNGASNWIVSEARGNVRTDGNYYVFYSCTWTGAWNCPDSWKLYQTFEEPVPIHLNEQTQILVEQEAQNLEQIAIQRREQMLTLAENNPEEFLQNVMLHTQRQNLPAEIRAHVERPIQTQGSVKTIIYDDFESESTTENMLEINNQEVTLRGHDPIGLSGTQVSVQGYLLQDQLVVSEQTLIQEQNEVQTTGVQNLLVVPLQIDNASKNGITQEDIRQSFVGEGAIVDWFSEVSHGNVELNVTVSDWMTMPSAYSPQQDMCTIPSFVYILRAVDRQGINLSKYQRIHFPVSTDCPNQDAGFALQGPGTFRLDDGSSVRLSASTTLLDFWGVYKDMDDYSTLDLDTFQLVTIHELGHQFGGGHSGTLECDYGEHPLHSSSCEKKEYGNDFDVLGNSYGGHATHFNAYIKELFGWTQPLNINKTGVYTLYPYQLNKQPIVAKIQTESMESNEAIYISYRQAIGMDQDLAGPEVNINTKGLMVTHKYPNFRQKTQQLDLRYEQEDPDWKQEIFEVALTDWSLTDKQYFWDRQNNYSIGPVIYADEEKVEFEVNFPVEMNLSIVEYRDNGYVFEWESNAQYCRAWGGWIGQKDASGTQFVENVVSDRYELICRAGIFSAKKELFLPVMIE